MCLGDAIYNFDRSVASPRGTYTLDRGSEAFVTLIVGDEVRNTGTEEINSATPEWNECFVMGAVYPVDTPIVFVVADADAVGTIFCSRAGTAAGGPLLPFATSSSFFMLSPV